MTITDQTIATGRSHAKRRRARRRRTDPTAAAAQIAQPTWRLGIAAIGSVNSAHSGALDRVAAGHQPRVGSGWPRGAWR